MHEENDMPLIVVTLVLDKSTSIRFSLFKNAFSLISFKDSLNLICASSLKAKVFFPILSNLVGNINSFIPHS